MDNNLKNQFSAQAKRDRFIRLAALRANIVLERLRVLGHCANKSAYSYSEKDIEKIFSEIEDEVRLIKSKFIVKTRRTIVLD